MGSGTGSAGETHRILRAKQREGAYKVMQTASILIGVIITKFTEFNSHPLE